MRYGRTMWSGTAAVAAMVVAAASPSARAVKIGDVTRFQGEFPNKLIGTGLVVGLPGTGDGGAYLPAIRPLREFLARMGNPVGTLDELKDAKNVAIVLVEATLPENGVREGDRIDVQVSSLGAAKSLAQGRLLFTPMLAAPALGARIEPGQSDPPVLAFASGPLAVMDSKQPRTAVVRGGATVEADIVHSYIAFGRDLEHVRQAQRNGGPAARALLDWVRPEEPYVTLVIDRTHANWAMANIIAQMINDDQASPDGPSRDARAGALAMAIDRSNVLVRIPPTAQHNAAPFLAWIETLDLLMPQSEARVIVNRATGSVIISGDVEISPVVITFKGLTIQAFTPEPEGAKETPQLQPLQFAPLDPGKQGKAKLRDLVAALNSLKVPPDDRVHIIEQLHEMGKLHAKLIVEP